jgi:hypothetical protein
LDPQQSLVYLADEIEVRAVTERDQNGCAPTCQPLDRGRFSQIALLATVDDPFRFSLHAGNVRSNVGRFSRTIEQFRETWSAAIASDL